MYCGYYEKYVEEGAFPKTVAPTTSRSTVASVTCCGRTPHVVTDTIDEQLPVKNASERGYCPRLTA